MCLGVGDTWFWPSAFFPTCLLLGFLLCLTPLNPWEDFHSEGRLVWHCVTPSCLQREDCHWFLALLSHLCLYLQLPCDKGFSANRFATSVACIFGTALLACISVPSGFYPKVASIWTTKFTSLAFLLWGSCWHDLHTFSCNKVISLQRTSKCFLWNIHVDLVACLYGFAVCSLVMLCGLKDFDFCHELLLLKLESSHRAIRSGCWQGSCAIDWTWRCFGELCPFFSDLGKSLARSFWSPLKARVCARFAGKSGQNVPLPNLTLAH